jgi:putative ABC transport system permease protein
MNFRQLIIRNLKGNFRTYAAYFVSSTFAALVFYIFSLLLFHPQLKENLSASETISFFAEAGLNVSLVIIALLSLLFLWYTFVVFLKRRKRDLAIYLILGIEERDLRKILFIENALLGSLATFLGIGLGVLGTKLLLLIAQNVMHLSHGLTFVIPLASLGLTLVVYLVMFLLISFFSTRTLQGEKIISLIKENEKPRPEPKSHWLLALSGVLLLFAGYGSVCYFSVFGSSLIPLLAGVLLTVGGTILCFNQFSVFLLKRLKGRSSFLKGTRLLTISEWLFRMRDNATMYSLIAISTSVAFVGISVMMAIGNTSFSSVQGISVAYVFSTYSKDSVGQTKALEVKNILEEHGYQPAMGEVELVGAYAPLESLTDVDDPYYAVNSFSIMKESDYQRLMKQIGTEADSVKDNQILELSGNYSRRKELLTVDQSQREYIYPIEIGEGSEQQEITVVHSPSMLSINFYGLAVVTDKTFEKWQKMEDTSEAGGFVWLDYPEWADDPVLVDEINQEIDQKNKAIDEELSAIYDSLGDDATEEEWSKAVEGIPDQVMYDSKYQVFQETRQGNGIILMITVLLGSVFFIFSASIIYFRLFADLDKDGAYHRSLHILGVSPKERHQILRRQLQVMYFLPTIVAMLHFSVAMIALRLLVELPVWQFYGKIVGLYLLFQVAFYIFCQFRYIKQIDRYADPTED